ncbi:MAG: hypothetical protein KGI25_09260 [Thaumarchaeota archaeon]|nr:hypothetical protein [Nitrososphaerota archaeon]
MRKMFNQSMGEVVVSVFFYMGVGSAIVLGGVIGIILLEGEIRKIARIRT